MQRLSAFQLRFWIGLDLSAQSALVGVFKPQAPHRTPLLSPPITDRLLALATAYEDSVLGGVRMLANGLKQDFARQGLGGMAQTVPYGASVAALAGVPAPWRAQRAS